MTTQDFVAMAQQCAPAVAPRHGGHCTDRIGIQSLCYRCRPRPFGETASARGRSDRHGQALQAAGWNYSAGLTQINRENWSRYGLTARTVFDVCRNLSAGAAILRACFMRPRHSCRSTRGVARSAVVLCEREFRNRLSRRVCTADRGGRGVGRHDRPCAVVIGKADSSNTRPCDWIPG